VEKVYSYEWSQALSSLKWEECEKSVLNDNGYLDTKIFNFSHLASLKFRISFSFADQL